MSYLSSAIFFSKSQNVSWKEILEILALYRKDVEIYRGKDGNFGWIKMEKSYFAHAKESVLCPGSAQRWLNAVVALGRAGHSGNSWKGS